MTTTHCYANSRQGRPHCAVGECMWRAELGGGTCDQVEKRNEDERAAQLSASTLNRKRESVAAELAGDPPRGATLAGWRAWVDATRDELDALESARDRLSKHLAPTDTAATL